MTKITRGVRGGGLASNALRLQEIGLIYFILKSLNFFQKDINLFHNTNKSKYLNLWEGKGKSKELLKNKAFRY